MSAGPVVDRDPAKLAPRFRAAVEAALADCHADGLDAYVYEAVRSRDLAVLYYARGRTVKPPERPVTNAPDETYSWHGYGLAVDVISRAHDWDRPTSWFADVAGHFKRHGCKWGGDWKQKDLRQKDLPHFQWGACKPSPSDEARRLLAEGGMPSVWRRVGADGGD